MWSLRAWRNEDNFLKVGRNDEIYFVYRNLLYQVYSVQTSNLLICHLVTLCTKICCTKFILYQVQTYWYAFWLPFVPKVVVPSLFCTKFIFRVKVSNTRLRTRWRRRQLKSTKFKCYASENKWFLKMVFIHEILRFEGIESVLIMKCAKCWIWFFRVN